MNIQNTQNKIYNITRRTYIDEKDCKEGESLCRKCKGVGEVTRDGGPIQLCSQCLGRGIVDWVTQAVERPPVLLGNHGTSYSGPSVQSGSSGMLIHGTSGTGQAGSSKPTNVVKITEHF